MLGNLMRVSGAATVIVAAFFVLPARADEQSIWRKNQTFSTESSSAVRPNQDCYQVSAEVIQESGAIKIQQVCETRGKNLTLGKYTDSDNKKYYAIKIGFDRLYRNIANVSAYDTRIYLRPSDDALIVKFPGAQNPKTPYFSVFRLDDRGISPKLSNGQGTIEYQLNFAQRSTLMELQDTAGSSYYTPHNGYAISEDRKFILSWLTDNSIVVTDTMSGEMRIISALKLSGKIDATISDDGRYVALGTRGLIFDTEGCGEAYDYTMHRTRVANGLLRTACPMTDVRSQIYDIANIAYLGANFYFVDDNTALAFDFPRENPHTHGLIKTEAYNPLQLDYLALGDSYSSGEGDTETIGDTDVKWYRPWTNNQKTDLLPEEKCHVSIRSYPYLLAEKMNLDYGTQWQTVACSGATAWDIKAQGSSDYLGQNDRLARYETQNLKAIALNEFIPGRHKQVEFVKKYKPKAITLTAGGNDVKFGEKLATCAKGTDTCEFARYSFRENMKSEIEAQFAQLRSLYLELVNASPNTAVYVLGYPQFINADPNAHCKSTFNLNAEERELVASSVIYLNNIIEAAANSAGVTYIDTENALGGHRICDENEKHVTAITGFLGYGGNDIQESFHPNHLGHSDLAKTVSREMGDMTLLDYPLSGLLPANPSVSAETAVVPPYFSVASASEDSKTSYYKLTNGILVKSRGEYHIWTGKFVFGPGSEVSATLYSDPTSLGNQVAASDGSMSITFNVLDSIPAGYHTLILRGKSYSGESLTLYQTVQINGPDEDDIDEDGVVDAQDSCIFFKGDDTICPLNSKSKEGIDTKGHRTDMHRATEHSVGTPEPQRSNNPQLLAQQSSVLSSEASGLTPLAYLESTDTIASVSIKEKHDSIILWFGATLVVLSVIVYTVIKILR